MAPRSPRSVTPGSRPLEAMEDWPFRDQDVLMASRSRQVCLTCHWFRHHAGPNCIPLLTCQLHQGLIAQGEHLSHRCQGWTDDLTRQRGWAPEAG
ncbi:MAG: galactose oxidase [Cyanobacteria bacterium K_Offshore_surface_m2_239]|nr:galactose oxidase [Cyanobacteria bacterium K_Offshore_surface_m2_239]